MTVISREAPPRETVHGRLEVQGLAKAFGGQPVLEGVDLSVERGSTVALLGPSGCGKTTLLRTIAGLETPDAGEISLSGRTLSAPGVHVPPERRRIGMVFQDWALFPHLDVGSNVAYGLGKEERGSARVSETLEMVGLGGFGDRMPNTLSGGQQQRVALARAIAPRPSAILLDEPFSNLDAMLRSKVRSDTHRLLREIGMTTLFVTHDQAEAFVLGDEVAVMNHGTICQQATPNDIYARPANPWVAAFVGEANLVNADAMGGSARSMLGMLDLEHDTTGPCTLLLRPEQLTLLAGDNGEILDIEFYGHDTSYRVAVGDEEVLVRAIAGPRFAPGDRVGVAYQGPPVMAYPDTTTRT